MVKHGPRLTEDLLTHVVAPLAGLKVVTGKHQDDSSTKSKINRRKQPPAGNLLDWTDYWTFEQAVTTMTRRQRGAPTDAPVMVTKASDFDRNQVQTEAPTEPASALPNPLAFATSSRRPVAIL